MSDPETALAGLGPMLCTVKILEQPGQALHAVAALGHTALHIAPTLATALHEVPVSVSPSCAQCGSQTSWRTWYAGAREKREVEGVHGLDLVRGLAPHHLLHRWSWLSLTSLLNAGLVQMPVV